MKKMKVVDKYVAIKALLNGESADLSVADAIEFINERIAITEKKNASGGGERKPTKTQLENEGIKEQIMSVLTDATAPMSIGDIGKEIGIPSCQKVSALVTQLVKAKLVVRSEVKGKAYFALATEE
jgi:hypothetical protein